MHQQKAVKGISAGSWAVVDNFDKKVSEEIRQPG